MLLIWTVKFGQSLGNLFKCQSVVSGRGGKEGAVGKCRNCKGTGMQVRIHQLAPGMVQQIQSVCHECRGEGESIDPKHMCKSCNGKKVTRERQILEVHIDKGNLLGCFIIPGIFF